MKIVVCDDDVKQLEILNKYLEEYSKIAAIKIEVKCYQDCDNLWWDLQSGLYADLFLLDIQMKNMTGIELARNIRSAHLPFLLCFISGIKDYVFEGYDLDALGYILKPFEKDQLYRLLDKAVKMMKQSNEFSIISHRKEFIKVYHKDILGLEAIGHDTKLYLRKGGFAKEQTLLLKINFSELIQQLSCPLFKTHRSFAVNMKNVMKISKIDCLSLDGVSFPIARGNYEACMQAFIASNKEDL